ncbi:MAG: bifunctional isocitrate dehydrogenase kinase/phosphatase [Pseudomonadales bacterium]|nr:bifunctional isocitrate dehydrogenase kinase/phosphatase [Pseudomonadales bacterium]
MPESGFTHRTNSEIASLIYNGFKIYHTRFQEVTVGAKKRFERSAWLDEREAGQYRLLLYKEHLNSVVLHITHPDSHIDGEPDTIASSEQSYDWPHIKASYVKLICSDTERELYETFFNSVHRKIAQDTYVNNAHMFVQSTFGETPFKATHNIYNTYHSTGDVVEMIERLLNSYNFFLDWQDMFRDAGNILRSLAEERPEIEMSDDLEVQMLKAVFYRNKAAYLIGRIITPKGVWPVALPILINKNGKLFVDTIICDADELSVVFSFSRSYFMVNTHSPRLLVTYLESLLPNKMRSELYSALGLQKHGKTEFYRGFLEHLDISDDKFIIAPGIKGMVMSVFILPSYETVFKVIKDKFTPPKKSTTEQVKESYTLVKRHDRVGRMADTQEFTNLILPRARFSAELLEELHNVAESSITVMEDHVIIKHVYTERLMTPLNIYIEREIDNPDGLKNALDEYGNAIKELAAANIFPGDLLLKNFGITRHGRVVFYDYDEICYLTEVNFRDIPEPQTPEQEMSAEPWYTVNPRDVFPEEFATFLFARPKIKQLFTKMHGDLFEASYWRHLQKQVQDGVVSDIFPYRRKKRFTRQLLQSN